MLYYFGQAITNELQLGVPMELMPKLVFFVFSALAGQLATALVIDHFGWLGLPVNPITWGRVAGVALLGIGVWLISR